MTNSTHLELIERAVGALADVGKDTHYGITELQLARMRPPFVRG